MIRHILLLATTLVLSSMAQDPEDIPLKVLYEIAPAFPHTDFCHHYGITNYWIDEEQGNVRHLTLAAKLREGETARVLCSCFTQYLSQKDLLKDVKIKCRENYGYGVLELIGKPDPTYNPLVKDKNLDQPIEKLQAIFNNIRKATPVGLKCTTNSYAGAQDEIHCILTCAINNDPRPIEKLCADIESYYNQSGWLVGVTISCNQNSGNVVTEFKGKP